MDVVSGIAVALVTVVVVAGALVTLGFVLLFRRRGDRGVSASGPTDSLSTRASALLVRLDDAVREADDELGYAIAQFGAERTRPYGEAVGTARQKVAEAFRITQRLDDAYPESDRQRRELTLQVIALCEQAEKTLAEQDAAFTSLRRQELNAAGTLAEVRARIEATSARIVQARATVAQLESTYAAGAYVAVADHPDRAEQALAGARAAADEAEPGIAASGVNDVSAALQRAAQSLREADQLLDAVDRTARDLAAAEQALEALRASTRADLVEAAAERDTAPDADTGKAIIDAMAVVEASLAAKTTPADPVAQLDSIGTAVAQLDLALASARNQAQRLAHARAAYEGTLVSVTSQIAAVKQYIASHGGGVEARTRLAEAQRQFAIAEASAATEPVDALDTIRRAVTLARDADALARYTAMGR